MAIRDTDPLFLSKYKPHSLVGSQAIAALGGAVLDLTPPVMGTTGINGADSVFPRFVMLQASVDVYLTVGNGGPAAVVPSPVAYDMKDIANSQRWFQLDGSGAHVKVYGQSGAGTCTPIWGC